MDVMDKRAFARFEFKISFGLLQGSPCSNRNLLGAKIATMPVPVEWGSNGGMLLDIISKCSDGVYHSLHITLVFTAFICVFCSEVVQLVTKRGMLIRKYTRFSQLPTSATTIDWMVLNNRLCNATYILTARLAVAYMLTVIKTNILNHQYWRRM